MMNKRKASGDRNTRQISASRRASMASLSGKNDISQQKHSRPDKSPSAQNIHQVEQECPPKAVLVSKAVEACIPKTRFRSQDSKDFQSISSPRLKSFPAEKVKKFESLPQFSPDPVSAVIANQDARNSGNFFFVPSSMYSPNSGQGDTTRSQCQNVNNISQQQVTPQDTSHHIYQLRSGSEGALPQHAIPQNYQVHRPFVPNPNYGMVQNHPKHGGFQSRSTKELTTDIERQSIGGPSVTMHQQLPLSNMQQQQSQNREQISAQIAGPQIYNNPMTNSQSEHLNYSQSWLPVPSHQQMFQHTQKPSFQQLESQQSMRSHQQQPSLNQQQKPSLNHQQPGTLSPQQPGTLSPPQPQPNMLPPQASYFNYYTPHSTLQQSSQIGMTSPQDVTINHKIGHIRNLKNAMYNTDYPVNNNHRGSDSVVPFNSGWVPNYPGRIDYVNGQTQPGTHPGNLNSNNELKVARQQYPGEQSTNPNQGLTPMKYKGSSQEPIYPSNQQDGLQASTHSTNHNNQNPNGSNVQFTPDMIRDQEMLVNTMRQQGVPDYIMRRQFDALLQEQRKHLTFLSQMYSQEKTSETKRIECQPRQRKQIDEKPEWMMHITPPRFMYGKVNQSNVRENKEQHNSNAIDQGSQKQLAQEMEQRKISQGGGQQVQNSQMTMQNQGIVQPRGEQLRYQHASKLPTNNNVYYSPTQQNYHNAMIQNNANTNQNVANHTHMNNYHMQGKSFLRNEPGLTQYQRYPEYHDQVSKSNEFPTQKSNPNSSDSNRQSSEVYSLLKMKVYKEVIRPKNRNNGLQDFESVQNKYESLKNLQSTKGLEYLSNMDKAKGIVKLNGVQDSSEVHPDLIQAPLMENPIQRQKRISANGLENGRNSNNPPQQHLSCPQRSVQETSKEYPRQKEHNPRNCYSMQAQRDNQATIHGQQNIQNYQPLQFPQQQFQGYQNVIPWNNNSIQNSQPLQNNSAMYKSDSYSSQCQHQLYDINQNYSARHGGGESIHLEKPEGLNRMHFSGPAGDTPRNIPGNGVPVEITKNQPALQEFMDPGQRMGYGYIPQEIQEAKTIGGIRYLARKPMYIPSQRMSLPETSVINRNPQYVTSS